MVRISPIKAIRLKCLDCNGDSKLNVRTCPCTDCTLWEFRMGKRPETIREKNPLMMDKAFFDANVELETTLMDKKLKGCNP